MRLIHTPHTILDKFYPEVEFEFDDKTQTFKWISENHPTVEELDQLVVQENKKEQEGEVRSKRNKLLEESDYIVIKSLESGDAIPTEWKTYRQELRDMDFSDYNNINWPEKPS